LQPFSFEIRRAIASRDFLHHPFADLRVRKRGEMGHFFFKCVAKATDAKKNVSDGLFSSLPKGVS
jgi:hypothetical protein